MTDIRLIEQHPGVPSPFWTRLATYYATFQCALTRTTFKLRGPHAFKEPVLFATNASQKYDFLPFRYALKKFDLAPTMTLVKSKYYQSALARAALNRAGSIPIVSKGYLITLDFRAVTGRRPTNAEYRVIRDAIDSGDDLPSELQTLLQTKTRRCCGRQYEAGTGYSTFMRGLYADLLAALIERCKYANRQGVHIHIYPEGTTSGRLGQGRIGAVQMAWATGLPIVPVGISGTHTAMSHDGVMTRPGEIELHFGEPIKLPSDLLPASFTAFSPADERTYAEPLQAWTKRIMDELDRLLPSSYGYEGQANPTMPTGASRFL